MAEPVGRLLRHPSGMPAENMAIDQAILAAVDHGGPPTLRLYGWSEPTLSLGYFQALADRSRHTASTSLPCVRRATGGGAIVHDRELTYSLVLPTEDRNPGPRQRVYRQSHQAIANVLSDFGIRAMPYRSDRPFAPAEGADAFLCFQRRTAEDLIVCCYKVLGSAQRRGRRAILQHGSLLIGASRWAPELPGLNELSSGPLDCDSLANAIAESLAAVLGYAAWHPETLGNEERTAAEGLITDRFGHAGWLERR